MIIADIVATRADRQRYRSLVDSAVAAHMNMIRVWGGGLYPPQDFYDLCDERGVLVWQEAMMACALYPRDQAFLQEVVLSFSTFLLLYYIQILPLLMPLLLSLPTPLPLLLPLVPALASAPDSALFPCPDPCLPCFCPLPLLFLHILLITSLPVSIHSLYAWQPPNRSCRQHIACSSQVAHIASSADHHLLNQLDCVMQIHAEVQFQMRRINWHPSVVIWGGNNEVETAMDSWFDVAKQSPQLYVADYTKLFLDTVQTAVAEVDPEFPFVDSSPSNGLISKQPYVKR